jgi:hypothetical protein
MIQKNNPIVLSQNFENNQRPLISLNEQNFVLAFAVVDYDNIIRMEDPTIFSLTVSVITWDRINNEFNVSRTGTEPCTEKYFNKFPNEFHNFNLSFARCPSTRDFSLQGFWDESMIRYFQNRFN